MLDYLWWFVIFPAFIMAEIILIPLGFFMYLNKYFPNNKPHRSKENM